MDPVDPDPDPQHCLKQLQIRAQLTDDCQNQLESANWPKFQPHIKRAYKIYERPDNQRQYFGRLIQGSAGENRTLQKII